MSVLRNFVLGETRDAIDASASTIRLTVASPYKLPAEPLPSGRAGWALLLDDPKRPTAFELIRFTIQTASRIEGVTRGADGTTAQAWPAGTQLTQDIPQALAESLQLDPATGDILVRGEEAVQNATPDYGDTSGKLARSIHEVFEETAAPSTPSTGLAEIFLDSSDGDLKVIFDTATTAPLVTAPPVDEVADAFENGGFSTSFNATKPSNVANGDYVLLAAYVLGQAGQSFTAPTGFTTIASVGAIATANDAFLWLGYRVIDGTEGGAFTFSIGAFGAATWQTRRITGVSSVGTAQTATTGTGTATGITIPAVTYNKSLVVTVAVAGDGTATLDANTTAPSGYTKDVPTDRIPPNFYAYKTEAGSGSTGSLGWSTTSEPAQMWCGIAVPLNG